MTRKITGLRSPDGRRLDRRRRTGFSRLVLNPWQDGRPEERVDQRRLSESAPT